MPGPLDACYRVLGVPRAASDLELRSAYRGLVQLHHPDHNGGSREAALRFEAIRAAYVAVVEERRAAAASKPVHDPEIEARVAALERELTEARRHRPPPAGAAGSEPPRRASEEELGRITTQDSFTKILDDALDRVFGERKG